MALNSAENKGLLSERSLEVYHAFKNVLKTFSVQLFDVLRTFPPQKSYHHVISVSSLDP